MRSRSMQVFVVTAALAGLAGWAAWSRAAEAVSTVSPRAEKSTGQFLVLVQSQLPLEDALITGIEMLGDRSPLPARSYTVVVVGEGVVALAKDSKLAGLLADARGRGVRIVASRIALERAQLTADQLSASVEIVANGLMETFRLKAMNYLSIEL